MFLKKYLPKIKISQSNKREYKKFLLLKGKLNAANLLFFHVLYILINYSKLSKVEKQKSYIYVRYNAADNPILTIGC